MQQPRRVNSTEIDPKYQNRIIREDKVVKIDAMRHLLQRP